MCGIALLLAGRLLSPSVLFVPAEEPWLVDEPEEGAGDQTTPVLWPETQSEPLPSALGEGVLARLARRGPDAPPRPLSLALEARPGQAHERLQLVLAGATLHMRGPTVQAQPMQAPSGSQLLFNGELWAGLDGLEHEGAHDGRLLLDALERCQGDEASMLSLLSGCEGPWALIYWHAASGKLLVAKDVLGRRSLVAAWTQHEQGQALVLSSVADSAFASHWRELPPRGLYFMEDRLWRLRPWPRRPVVYEPAPLEGEMTFQQAVLGLEGALRSAVRRMVAGARPGETAVLFSGGVDSTVLALLAAQEVSNGLLHLITVAFKDDAPDVKAANSAVEELRRLLPRCDLRLVHVRPTAADVVAVTDELRTLLLPHRTQLSASIGCALLFASRGAPVPVRILLTGHGADEHLGGYGRHHTALKEGGWAALRASLSEDVGRLWTRNLGRDDRVLSDSGREGRQPFLDEGVARAVAAIPAPLRTGARHQGEEDKRVLREVARRLGLQGAAVRDKQAIQFGSRSSRVLVPANTSVKGVKGTDKW